MIGKFWDEYFNCTIQELKLTSIPSPRSADRYFNCTIQELKHVEIKIPDSMEEPFQLHHTGIKTRRYG